MRSEYRQRYRKVNPRIWNDEKFREFTDDGKLVFFFLLTHPQQTMLGAMRASIPGLAAEIGWKEDRFRDAISAALGFEMLMVDEDASFVWLPNFLNYNPPESPNVVKAWAAALDHLPECKLKNDLCLAVREYSVSLTLAFRKVLPIAFRNQEQEQEQELEQDKETSVQELVRFIKQLWGEWTDKTQIPDINDIQGGRQTHLLARINEDEERLKLPWWAAYFKRIRESDFLTGKKNNFTATFDWVINPANMTKILEGNYDNREQPKVDLVKLYEERQNGSG